MKKLLLFIFALFLWTGAWADKTVYLNPGIWDVSDADEMYAIWAFEGTASNSWIEMTSVPGTIYYQAEIPEDYTKIILTRRTSGGTASWDPKNILNQTDDIETFGDKTLFTIIDWNGSPNNNSGYSYSGSAVTLYTANFTNSIGWNEVYAYAYTESGSTTKYTGEWPGAKLTAGTISFFATEAPANIIFNCGYSGNVDSSIKPYYQTGNLTFEEGMTADVPAIENGGYGRTVLSGGLCNGKTLHYTYQFTQSGQDVTVAFTYDGNSLTGIVDGYVWDVSTGLVEYSGLSHTWKNCSFGQAIKAQHKWLFNSGDFLTPIYSFLPDGPTTKANVEYPNEGILKVYTDNFKEGTSGSGYGKGSHIATWTSTSECPVAGSNILYIHGNGYSHRTESSTVATGYKTAYVAVYPKNGGVLYVFDDNGNSMNPFATVTANQWNVVRLPVSFGTDYIGFSIEGETDLFVDYIVLSTEETDMPFGISTEDSNGLVTVEGNLSSTNKDQLSAITAAAIDLTGAVIAAETGAITTANPNVMFVINEDDLTKISGTSNVVRNHDAVWNVPLTSLSFTDANGNRIYTGKFLSGAGAQNKSYTRTISANKYVTTMLPVQTDIPSGVTAYEFTGYENGVITVTKVNDTKLTAHTPYVLFAEGNANLTFTSAGDVEFGDRPVVTYSEVTFKGIYSQIVTTGSENPSIYVLSGNEIKKAAGATIGGFRAYFTGNIAAAAEGKASVLFVENGETTHIGTIDANGNINVENCAYNLAGQKVGKDYKGIVIVNGKKYVRK